MGCSRCGCCTLDISLPSKKLVHYVKQGSSNVLRLSFCPKNGVKITRVCDGNSFEREFDFPVYSGELYHKDGKPYLMVIHLKRGNSSYFMCDDAWREITEDKFDDYQYYLIMLGSPEKHITIDVNKPKNNEHWKINEFKNGERKRVEFWPNIGYYTKAVVDGDTTIWKAENDAQGCENVTLFCNQNEKELVEVEIRDMTGTNSKYYQCVKGKWEETDEDTFSDAEYSYDIVEQG